MRIFCWYCHKSVSSELPNWAIVRAIAVCPECIEKSPEADNHPLNIVALTKKDKEIEKLRLRLKEHGDIEIDKE